MSNINSDVYSQLGINKVTETKTNATDNSLGQTEYLELMTAQLMNQDPLEPMENGDFIGQMASFGTVSGIGDLNNTMNDFAAAFQSNQALQASTMVGRNVLVKSDVVSFNSEGIISASVDLDQSASNVVINVTDASGQLVDRRDLGVQSAGLVNYQWDGQGANGQQYSSGQYKITAEVQQGGETSSGVTLTSELVESVTLGKGGQDLTLTVSNLGDISMSQIRKIM